MDNLNNFYGALKKIICKKVFVSAVLLLDELQNDPLFLIW